MRTITVPTAAEGVKYNVTVQQFESREELDAKLGDDGVLTNINSLQAQNGKQGGKGEVRDAIRTFFAKLAGIDVTAKGFDVNDPAIANKIRKAKAGVSEEEILADPDVQQAIKNHQDGAAKYILGTARSSGGPTQKAKLGFSDRITQHTQEHGAPPTQEELLKIMQEMGMV